MGLFLWFQFLHVEYCRSAEPEGTCKLLWFHFAYVWLDFACSASCSWDANMQWRLPFFSCPLHSYWSNAFGIWGYDYCSFDDLSIIRLFSLRKKRYLCLAWPYQNTLLIVLMYLVGKAAGSGAVLWKSGLLPLFRCAFVTCFSCKSTVCGRDVHNVVGLWYLCVLLSVSSEDMSVCTVCCLFMCACLLPTNYFCSYGLCCGDAL